MADTVAAPAPAAAEPTRGRKRLLLVVVVALAAIAAGTVAARMVLAPSEAAADVPAAPVEGDVVTIGQMTTSLAGPGTHYARVDLAAVLEASADATTVEERFPLLRDRALSVLMGFDAERLRTVKGADALRAKLTEQAQQVWQDDEVVRIVLTDLLVQ